jgi:hypothetical protein
MSFDVARLVENHTDSLAIGPGEVVSIEYTVSDDEGKELETNRGRHR